MVELREMLFSNLNVMESLGDLGVVSYLADADGNVVIGPTTSISPALLSKTPMAVKSKNVGPATSTTPASPTSGSAATAPHSPSSTTPLSEGDPTKKTTIEKKTKKKLTQRKDSVILKLPVGEVESDKATPTIPVTPGSQPAPEASAEELE